jgi:hypothetical protein
MVRPWYWECLEILWQERNILNRRFSRARQVRRNHNIRHNRLIPWGAGSAVLFASGAITGRCPCICLGNWWMKCMLLPVLRALFVRHGSSQHRPVMNFFFELRAAENQNIIPRGRWLYSIYAMHTLVYLKSTPSYIELYYLMVNSIAVPSIDRINNTWVLYINFGWYYRHILSPKMQHKRSVLKFQIHTGLSTETLFHHSSWISISLANNKCSVIQHC